MFRLWHCVVQKTNLFQKLISSSWNSSETVQCACQNATLEKIAVVIFLTILRSTVQLLIGNYLVCLGRLYNYRPVFLMVQNCVSITPNYEGGIPGICHVCLLVSFSLTSTKYNTWPLGREHVFLLKVSPTEKLMIITCKNRFHPIPYGHRLEDKELNTCLLQESLIHLNTSFVT